MSKICKISLVYGIVQDVGFRYSTQIEATRLGLGGYVRNLDDGSVEVLVCGNIWHVERLITWLEAGGPRSAKVKRVLTEVYQPEREYVNFRILY